MAASGMHHTRPSVLTSETTVGLCRDDKNRHVADSGVGFHSLRECDAIDRAALPDSCDDRAHRLGEDFRHGGLGVFADDRFEASQSKHVAVHLALIGDGVEKDDPGPCVVLTDRVNHRWRVSQRAAVSEPECVAALDPELLHLGVQRRRFES